jgi:hypothetical protein
MQRKWAMAFILLGLFALSAWGVYTFKSQPHPGANDFYSRWSGVKSFWLEGLNPYGSEASLAIQIGIYGRPVQAGEDPGYYAYPMYTTLLLAPLAPLPYAAAEAIWLTLLMALQIAALVLLLDVYRWRPSPIMLGSLILFVIFFYPASRGVLLGQPGLLVYFLEVLTIWALVKGRDGLAGAALALSTIKPQMGFMVVPFLLLWALRERRWRMIGWFAGVWLGLMLWSFAVLPGWFGDWLDQLSRYTSYTAIGSPVWVLTRVYLPFLGAAGEVVISALLVAGMLWAWFEVIVRQRRAAFGWTLAFTLTVTHLVALRTATPHFVVFVMPLVFYLKQLIEADRRRGQTVAALLLAVLVIGLWGLFLFTVDGKFEHPVVYLPVPFGMLTVLLLSRRLWMAARPLAPARYEGAA